MSLTHRLDCLPPLGRAREQGLLPIPLEETEKQKRFSKYECESGKFLSFSVTLDPRKETTDTQIGNHHSSFNPVRKFVIVRSE